MPLVQISYSNKGVFFFFPFTEDLNYLLIPAGVGDIASYA